MLRFWILCDNDVRRAHILAEHGLSLWIEHNSTNILFDAGQTDVWLKNARTLKISPETVSAVVLSHGHYDHCGGLPYFPFAESRAMVYATPQAFQKKLSKKNGAFHDIGMRWKPGDSKESEGRIASTEGRTEILPGVWTLADVGSYTAFESVPDSFFTERDGVRLPDRMDDEQILVVKADEGLAVFSGCSHRGAVNCVEHVRRSFPGKRIRFFVAGMHLSEEGEDRIRQTADYFAQSEIEKLIPLHCTGIQAAAQMKRILGDRCILAGAGDRIDLC